MKTQGIISIVLGVSGACVFTGLLLCAKIGDVVYVALLTLLSLVCITIAVIGRLRQLNFKKLTLTLNEIEEAKKEIYAKEKSLKEASFILSEIIALSTVLGQLHGDTEIEKVGNELIDIKLEKLAKSLKLSSSFNEEVLKYGAALSKARKANSSAGWNELYNLLKAELQK